MPAERWVSFSQIFACQLFGSLRRSGSWRNSSCPGHTTLPAGRFGLMIRAAGWWLFMILAECGIVDLLPLLKGGNEGEKKCQNGKSRTLSK
jgi:hypothetical protein